MIGSAVSEPLPYFSLDARGAFEQAAVQIEHVAGIRFAAGRTLQHQRHLAIRDGVLGEIVVNDQRVHAVVHEPFAHRRAGERREVLVRRGIGRRRHDDDRVRHRAGFFEHGDDARDLRLLLADRDVDAVERTEILVACGLCGPVERAWLMIVSTPMVVLPVERSPMINSRWPRPIGIIASIAMMPVCTGWLTDLRLMMPGAIFSTG